MSTIRENPGILLIALLIAVLIKGYVWVIDPPTSVEINVPIELKNVPAGLSVSSIVPNKAELELRGQKSKVERYREWDFHAIADCSEITEEGQHEVKIRLSQSRFQGVSRYMIPDTVHLIVGRSETKFCRPEMSISGEFRENRTVSSIEGLPETIAVSGTSTTLSMVSKIQYTLQVDRQVDSWTDEVTFIPVGEDGKIVPNLKLEPEKSRITVHLSEHSIQRNLPVVLHTSGTPAVDYTIISQKVTPPTVQVTGDPLVINELTGIDTENISVAGLKTSVNRSVQLINPSTELRLEPDSVQVKIDISQLDTQRHISGIPITIRRQQDGYKYTLEPSTIDVHLRGPISTLKNLDINLVKATIFVSEYSQGSHTITLNDPGLPAGVILLSMTPKEVTLKVDKVEVETNQPEAIE